MDLNAFVKRVNDYRICEISRFKSLLQEFDPFMLHRLYNCQRAHWRSCCPYQLQRHENKQKLLNPSSRQLFQIQHFNGVNATLEKKNRVCRPCKEVWSPHDLIKSIRVAASRLDAMLCQPLCSWPSDTRHTLLAAVMP
jgi:hypothetical protein